MRGARGANIVEVNILTTFTVTIDNILRLQHRRNNCNNISNFLIEPYLIRLHLSIMRVCFSGCVNWYGIRYCIPLLILFENHFDFLLWPIPGNVDHWPRSGAFRKSLSSRCCAAALLKREQIANACSLRCAAAPQASRKFALLRRAQQRRFNKE